MKTIKIGDLYFNRELVDTGWIGRNGTIYTYKYLNKKQSDSLDHLENDFTWTTDANGIRTGVSKPLFDIDPAIHILLLFAVVYFTIGLLYKRRK